MDNKEEVKLQVEEVLREKLGCLFGVDISLISDRTKLFSAIQFLMSLQENKDDFEWLKTYRIKVENRDEGVKNTFWGFVKQFASTIITGIALAIMGWLHLSKGSH